MALYTGNKVRRLFSGMFTESGQFISRSQPLPAPHRYRCHCNPHGFTAGQIISHCQGCAFHPRNIEAFQTFEKYKRLTVVLSIIIGIACLGLFMTL